MKIFLFAIYILIGSAAAIAQVECRRYSEAAQGVSMCIPAGFTLRDNPGKPFKKFIYSDSSSNVNFITESTALSLEAFIAHALKNGFEVARSEGYSNFSVVGFTDFTTNAGAKGYRTEYAFNYKTLSIRSIQYTFKSRSSEILSITTTTTQSNTVVPSKSDEALKTLVLKP